jgi:hypothetical protein
MFFMYLNSSDIYVGDEVSNNNSALAKISNEIVTKAINFKVSIPRTGRAILFILRKYLNE